MFDDEIQFRVQVNDIDTEISNLNFAILIGNQEITGLFTEDTGEVLMVAVLLILI